jgi:hypothetical protein
MKRSDYYRPLLKQGWTNEEVALEMQADYLLYKSGAMSRKDKEVYTEYQLSQRIESENDLLSDYDPETIGEEKPIRDLALVQWREIEAGAKHINCSEAEIFYLGLRFLGHSYREIEEFSKGTEHAASDKTIKKAVQHAANRIVHAYPYFGLYEIIAQACGVSQAIAKNICRNQ